MSTHSFGGQGHRYCRGRRGGFTLLELLVVIAIIVLMVSILMPSLSRAREEGKAVKCLANFRSLANYTFMYKRDQPGETIWWYRIPFPPPGLPSPNVLTPWVFGGFRAPNQQDIGSGTLDSTIYPPQVRPLNAYAAPGVEDAVWPTPPKVEIDLYKCPGDRTWNTAIIGTGGPGSLDEQAVNSWQSNGSSYTLNTRFMQGYTWPPGNFGISELAQQIYTKTIAKHTVGLGDGAARFITWLEQGAYSAFYRAGPNLQESMSRPQERGWHRKFSYWAAGFADGHALYKYMDTRVAHGPDWTVWDPRGPQGGIP